LVLIPKNEDGKRNIYINGDYGKSLVTKKKEAIIHHKREMTMKNIERL